jgi:hypothetical protein
MIFTAKGRPVCNSLPMHHPYSTRFAGATAGRTRKCLILFIVPSVPLCSSRWNRLFELQVVDFIYVF